METIIVVDDDQVFCGLLKTVLEFENYAVVVEPDPDSVLPTIYKQQTKPTLILMDVHSEHGDTLPILRQLKGHEILKTIPVIMASGMDRSDECIAAGADAFLLKPFRPDELIELVREIIG